MSALKFWIRTIATDLTMLLLLLAWQLGNVEQAGNLFMFYAWAMIAVVSLAGLIADKRAFTRQRKYAAGYQAASTLITASACAWFGLFLTGAGICIAELLLSGARRREPKGAAQ